MVANLLGGVQIWSSLVHSGLCRDRALPRSRTSRGLDLDPWQGIGNLVHFSETGGNDHSAQEY